MYKVINIWWEFSSEDIEDIIDNMSNKEIAELLNVPIKQINHMDKEHIYDTIYDATRRNKIDLSEVLNLPKEIPVPEYIHITDIEQYDNETDKLTNYISDKYGWLINSYELIKVE